MQKLVVILGPTASGKTALGLNLAREFGGEIISADSRQIYKKINIGTDKPAGVWRLRGFKRRFLVEGIPHYGMDIVDPGKTFSVSDFKALAVKCVRDISGRDKLPFLVGGTGLYIWAVVDNLNFPKGQPKKKLRRSFEEKSVESLAKLLQKLDPESAAVIDLKNKRRLIRALEVAIDTGKSFVAERKEMPPLFECLQIGITRPLPELYERIEKRVDEQWSNGLPDEVRGLLRQRYSFVLPSLSSLGYPEVANYLKGELTKAEAVSMMKRGARRYAKRQLTWFKRDKRIHWVTGGDIETARALIKDFLNDRNIGSPRSTSRE